MTLTPTRSCQIPCTNKDMARQCERFGIRRLWWRDEYSLEKLTPEKKEHPMPANGFSNSSPGLTNTLRGVYQCSLDAVSVKGIDPHDKQLMGIGHCIRKQKLAEDVGHKSGFNDGGAWGLLTPATGAHLAQLIDGFNFSEIHQRPLALGREYVSRHNENVPFSKCRMPLRSSMPFRSPMPASVPVYQHSGCRTLQDGIISSPSAYDQHRLLST
ncbi:hypothetical protein BDZ97DRAFT_476093 [Flammula alnicola]|nr:hypothetical protein BDZ97DRAFT_476093 [Flammula alnicola]